MEKVLEQIDKLTSTLKTRISEVDLEKAIIFEQKNKIDSRQAELDAFEADLLDRESKVEPVENLEESMKKANELRVQAESEWKNIRVEWDKLKSSNQKHEVDCLSEKTKLADQKELYNRGAVANKIKQEKLDKKLKAFQELKG